MLMVQMLTIMVDADDDVDVDAALSKSLLMMMVMMRARTILTTRVMMPAFAGADCLHHDA